MKISKILVAAMAVICLGQTVNAANIHSTADTTKKSKMKMDKMPSKMDAGKMSDNKMSDGKMDKMPSKMDAGKMSDNKMSDGKMDKMSNKKMSPKMKKDSGKMSKM